MAGSGVGLEIRRAEIADLEALAHLEALAFADAWSSKSLADELAKASTRLWLASLEGQTVAYACFLTILDESELLRLAVLPEHRRDGLGRRMLSHCLHLVEASGSRLCHLEVRADNVAARRLYESLGFVVSGRRPGYYRDLSTDGTDDAVDAVLYQRPLDTDSEAKSR